MREFLIKLGNAERIAKVRGAVMPKLSPSERRKIFRFSVLTPEEWKEIRPRMVDEKYSVVGRRRVSASG